MKTFKVSFFDGTKQEFVADEMVSDPLFKSGLVTFMKNGDPRESVGHVKPEAVKFIVVDDAP